MRHAEAFPIFSMKRFWLTGLLLLWGVMTWAQQSYSAYYYQRVSLFEMLPVSPGDIVFWETALRTVVSGTNCWAGRMCVTGVSVATHQWECMTVWGLLCRGIRLKFS